MKSAGGAGGRQKQPLPSLRSGRAESPRIPAGAAEELEDRREDSREEAGAPQAPPRQLVASLSPIPPACIKMEFLYRNPK